MTNTDELNLVVARLESMPSHIKLSIGNFGSFDKWELIHHVKEGDEIGKLIIKVYMDNLRSFKRE